MKKKTLKLDIVNLRKAVIKGFGKRKGPKDKAVASTGLCKSLLANQAGYTSGTCPGAGHNY